MRLQFSFRQRVWFALAMASLVAVGLWAVGAARNHSLDFWYLPFNLALGVVPLLLSLWLGRLLKTRAWKSWLPLIVTFLWILFLPNSFYIVSDFIHLAETPRVDIVQDVVMLAQFSLTGLTIGFVSLFMVHREFIKRVNAQWAAPVAAGLLLLCSFAIYLGRDLRWNSWDIAVRPFALVGDIFDHVFHPFIHPQMAVVTLSFFVMLGSMYGAVWQIYVCLQRVSGGAEAK